MHHCIIHHSHVGVHVPVSYDTTVQATESLTWLTYNLDSYTTTYYERRRYYSRGLVDLSLNPCAISYDWLNTVRCPRPTFCK